MKKLIFTAALLFGIFMQAQVFDDASRRGMQLGMTIAKDNAGIYSSYEEQLGKYLSLGLNSILLLKKQEYLNEKNEEEKLDFIDKFDVKAKLSVHFSEVLNIDKFDFYPGLNVGIHNLGFHLGAQFYIAEGFAAFGKFNAAIAKYKESSLTSFNTSYGSLGVSIDL